jgi:succinate dehydrogenase flavin-adding protein (antitoxin of CptAB toxin-antitoxin module)
MHIDFSDSDQSHSIDDTLDHLSRKYHKYSCKKINPWESNHYTELLESKDQKILELESVILSLKDQIQGMRYSLNDKIENLKMQHKKELFMLHKQLKKHYDDDKS